MKKRMLTDNKELMKEWNYKRNINLNPSSLTHASSKKVWWICKKNHEWQASISSRTRGSNCPMCYRENNK